MSLATPPTSRLRLDSGRTLPATSRRRLAQALLVHDADVVRAGVASVLAGANVCDVSMATTIFEAIRMAAVNPPDIVLFAYSEDAARLLGGIWPRPKLVALAQRNQPIDPRACLQAGADAIIAVDSVTGEGLAAAAQRVLDGRSGIVLGFAGTFGEPESIRDRQQGPLGLLTPREREMLYLIGEGLSNREIAETLVLSVKTVEAHRANLSRKLNIRSRAGLMRLALARTVA